MWTLFWDKHSGGYSKEAWDKIYVEAPTEELAVQIFTERFSGPHDVACACCGSNYSVSSEETLEQASACHRGCRYDEEQKKYVEEPDTRYSPLNRPHLTLDEYVEKENVLVVRWDARVDAGSGI